MSSEQRQTEMMEQVIAHRKRAGEMIEKRLDAFYSRGVPVVNVWMALSFLAKMILNDVSIIWPSAIVYLACLVLLFFTDMKVTSKIVPPEKRWMMAYLSTVLQISAATALMLFFSTTRTVTVIPLFGLVLVFLLLLFRQMLGPTKPGTSWVRFKETLERGFELSALVVAPTVAGLSGKVLGYVQVVEGSASASNYLTTAVAPECVLFYGAVYGLFLLLLCTVPPSLSDVADVECMGKHILPIMAYLALPFPVVASLMAAQKILHEFIHFVWFPIAILAARLYRMDAYSSDTLPTTNITVSPDEEDSPDEQHRDTLSSYLLKPGISVMLLPIMAIHSRYGGNASTVSLNWPWKGFVSSALCSILSQTFRSFILHQKKNKRYKISEKVWTFVSIVTMIIAFIFGLLVICLDRDQVKNIF